MQSVAAALFVAIWSTGFIVAAAIREHTDPNLFLSVRFSACALIFCGLTVALSLHWPDRHTALKLLAIGGLMQGLYLGASFWAVGEGLQPGVMALFGSLQPPLTALLAARWFNETTSPLNRTGLALGVIGVSLAAWPAGGINPTSGMLIVAASTSVAAITTGTLLQKTSIASIHLVPSSALQNIGATLIVVALAVVLGESRFAINSTSIAALLYAVLVLSVGGATLLLWMVRQGSATQTTSLLFLAPPLAAILAWWLFDDDLSARQLAGFAIAMAGVWLARHTP
jgi:drug/metabolite transporter (DMT)-like permease